MAVKRYNGSGWDTVAGAGTPGAAGIVTSATAPSNTSVLWADTTVTTNNALIPAGGTTGQVLSKTSSSDYAASWSTPVGGKVLQVVSATYTTQTNNSTTTYADTNLTATITPTASTSKILVMVGHHHTYRDSGNSGNGLYIQLLRGATSLLEVFNLGYTATTLQQHGSATFVYLDSPATTSATTYKTQFKNNVNAGYVSVQGDGNMSTITLMEIGA